MDALFYQVFQFDPQALFQLMQLPVEGEYTYESITVKTTEKRMDGFFKRIDGEGPHFLQSAPSLDHCQSGGLPQRGRRDTRGVDSIEAVDAFQPGNAD